MLSPTMHHSVLRLPVIDNAVQQYLPGFTWISQSVDRVRLIRSSRRRHEVLRSAPYWREGAGTTQCAAVRQIKPNHELCDIAVNHITRAHDKKVKGGGKKSTIMSCIYNEMSHLVLCPYRKVTAGSEARPVTQGHADRFIPVANTAQTLPQSPAVGRQGSRPRRSPVEHTPWVMKESHCTRLLTCRAEPPARRRSPCPRRHYPSGTAWCFPAPLPPTVGGARRPQRALPRAWTPFWPSRRCLPGVQPDQPAAAASAPAQGISGWSSTRCLDTASRPRPPHRPPRRRGAVSTSASILVSWFYADSCFSTSSSWCPLLLHTSPTKKLQ